MRVLLGGATVLGFKCSQGWRSASVHRCAPTGYLQPVFLHSGPASILLGSVHAVTVIKYFGIFLLYAAMRKTPPETCCQKFTVH